MARPIAPFTKRSRSLMTRRKNKAREAQRNPADQIEKLWTLLEEETTKRCRFEHLYGELAGKN